MRRIVIVLFVVALAGACGTRTTPESVEARAAPTTRDPGIVTSGSVIAETETLSDEQRVLAAVDGFVASTITANDPPDPNHPDLGRYRVGAVLDNAVASVRQNQQLGIAYRWPVGSRSSHSGTVSALDADRAVVRNCVVDDAQQVAMADGRVLNSSVATKLFEAKLQRVDGVWKVAENSLLERWEGVSGCAASQ